MTDNLIGIFGEDTSEYRIYPNKFGMKYWAGAKRPDGAMSMKEIKRLLADEGYQNVRFYYPYPDHYFTLSLYSDSFLPRAGELRENIVNFNEDRYVFFDEGKAYDEIIGEGMYPFFANSFVALLNDKKQMPIFVRCATDRAERFSVRTEIYEENGRRRILKSAVFPEAQEHIAHIYEVWEKLDLSFEKVFLANACKWNGDKLELEYLEGKTLSSMIAEEGSIKLFEQYVAALKSLETIPFEQTDDFIEVFGAIDAAFAGVPSLKLTDIDLVPQNIIVRDDRWHVIDYEWTFSFPIPLDYVIYRAVMMTAGVLGNVEETREELFVRAGIGKERSVYEEMEREFQDYVCDGEHPMRDMVDLSGRLHADMRNTQGELAKLNDELNHIKNTRTWKARALFRKWIKGK